MEDEDYYKRFLKQYEAMPKVICPKCKTNDFVIPIRYGLADRILIRVAEEGKVKLMGCSLPPKIPSGYCKNCERNIP
jgi:hypothetical protein